MSPRVRSYNASLPRRAAELRRRRWQWYASRPVLWAFLAFLWVKRRWL